MSERRLYRTVVDEINTLIESGRYPPGSRLPPERELAERFKVSRLTVREAVIALEVLDKVRVKTGSGVYVIEPDKIFTTKNSTEPSILELNQALAIIEGEAAAIAAASKDTKVLKLLEAFAKTATESPESDEKFHTAIVESINNSSLMTAYYSLWKTQNGSPKNKNMLARALNANTKQFEQQYRNIAKAIGAGNSKAARDEVHSHFSLKIESMLQIDEADEIEKIKKKMEDSRNSYSLKNLNYR